MCSCSPKLQNREGGQRVGLLNTSVRSGLPALLGEAVERRLHMSVDAVVAAVRLGERWEKEQGGAGKLSQAGEV